MTDPGPGPHGRGPGPGRCGYADVNGLRMYYEEHGSGHPLVLLHGALSATETSFGALIPMLAEDHRVIAIEQQGHGRTADLDRPLTIANMADDTASLLAQLGVERADVLGYSLGANIALDLAYGRPDLVRKLVLISVSYSPGGLHAGVLETVDFMTPEALDGSPFHEEYLRLAPNAEDWPRLVAKVQDLDRHLPEISPEVIASIEAPMLIVIGDSDIVQPEHVVRMFRLVGGGVAGDILGMPRSQLAILPGTSHLSVVARAQMLHAMIPPFLDAPVKPARQA